MDTLKLLSNDVFDENVAPHLLAAKLKELRSQLEHETEKCQRFQGIVKSLETEVEELKQDLALAALPESALAGTIEPSSHSSQHKLLMFLGQVDNEDIAEQIRLWVVGSARIEDVISATINYLETNEVNNLGEFVQTLIKESGSICSGNFNDVLQPLFVCMVRRICSKEDTSSVVGLMSLIEMRVPQDQSMLTELLSGVIRLMKKKPSEQCFQLIHKIIKLPLFTSIPNIFAKLPSEQSDLILVVSHAIEQFPHDCMMILEFLIFKSHDCLNLLSFRCSPECLNVAQRIVVFLTNQVYKLHSEHLHAVKSGIRILARIACVRSDRASKLPSSKDCEFKPPHMFAHYAILLKVIASRLNDDPQFEAVSKLDVTLVRRLYTDLFYASSS